MITIYGRATSINVQKVMWTVGELGLEHERIDLGGRHGGLEEPAYLALNPHRRVPTLRDGETAVWESNAIMRYLAAQYGRGTLWAEDPGARAQQDQWMDWLQTTLAPDFYGLFWAVVRTPQEKRDDAAVARLLERSGGHYRQLERQLGDRPYLLGEELGLADLALGTTLHRWFTMEIARPHLPRLLEWYGRLQERPAYRRHAMVSYEELRGVT